MLLYIRLALFTEMLYIQFVVRALLSNTNTVHLYSYIFIASSSSQDTCIAFLHSYEIDRMFSIFQRSRTRGVE